MITEADRYYGCVLAQILSGHLKPIEIRRAYSDIQGVYLLDERLPIYVKISKDRFSPWNFNFQNKQQRLYQLLVDNFGDCISVFVCGNDGIVALNHDQLRHILDDNFEEQEQVSIKRKRREMYSIKGRDGELKDKIGRNSLNKIIEQYLIKKKA